MSRLARLQRLAAMASNYSVRRYGRWWRKRGYFDVWTRGVSYCGPMRYSRARGYILREMAK